MASCLSVTKARQSASQGWERKKAPWVRTEVLFHFPLPFQRLGVGSLGKLARDPDQRNDTHCKGARQHRRGGFFDFSDVAALAEVSAMVHVVDRTGFHGLVLGHRGNGHEPSPKRYKVS